MKYLVSILLFGLVMTGTFFLGVTFLGEPSLPKKDVLHTAKNLKQLLRSPQNYKFTVNKIDISSQPHKDWFAVEDKSPDKTGYIYWELNKFGNVTEHVFEFLVKKEKKISWSQIQLRYSKTDKSDVFIYMFKADTGQILFQGKTASNMLKIQDEGDSWRITGYAIVPNKAVGMQIFLYPSLGKKGMGTLRIKEFTLGSPA